MEIAALFKTHTIARHEGKSPFFFSRFNFIRMKEKGNTHYCFYCGGSVGFRPGKKKEVTNSVDDSGYNSMNRHDPVSHADGIVANADKFDSPHRWLASEIPKKGFPFIVSIPSV